MRFSALLPLYVVDTTYDYGMKVPSGWWENGMPRREVAVTPGVSAGRDAGVFRERGPRGGMLDNFTTIPEHHKAPPTSKPGSEWVRIDPTPHGHRSK